MKIGIIGTGALGIAFAKILCDSNDIIMWTKFEFEKEELEIHRENKKFLPGVVLDNNIEFTNDLKDLKETEVIIVAVPFVAITDVAYDMVNWYNGQVICSTTKGIEDDSFRTSTDILKDVIQTDKICALSGPSFAMEIVHGNKIHLMLGAKSEEVSEKIMQLFAGTNLILEPTCDISGIQLAGAIKNAIAIGSGMLDGLKEADSTKAAYLASGVRELSNILEMFGSDRNTAYSYAGIGDLMLTCTSEQSRNFTFGKLLGEGLSVQDAFDRLGGKTVEGFKIIRALNGFVKGKKIDTKLIQKLYDIIFNQDNINNIVF